MHNYVDGQLRGTMDAAGTPDETTVLYTYDPATSQKTSVIDDTGATTTFAYDAFGNLRSTTDALGDMTSATDPAGNTATATFDVHGNQLTGPARPGGCSGTRTTPTAPRPRARAGT